MHFEIEIQEEQENGGVEDGIENPSSDSVAAAFDEMEQQDSDVAEDVAPQEHHLAVHHEREARAPEPDRRPESVGVDDGIYRCGEEDGEDLEGLGEFQPEE